MADANRAAFSMAIAAVSTKSDNDGSCHDRNSDDRADGTQSSAGDRASLVLSQPFPCNARPAPLRRVHGVVTRL